MRDNTRPVWLALAVALWAGLPAYAQPGNSRPPLPQTESSPAASEGALPDSSILRSVSDPVVLPAEEAFQLSALFEGDTTLLLSWTIAPGHYLYRDQFRFLDAHGQLLPAALPAAVSLVDEYFGETHVYFESLQVRFPLSTVPLTAEGDYLVRLTYQGCAKDRYCYPPAQQEVRLTLPR